MDLVKKKGLEADALCKRVVMLKLQREGQTGRQVLQGIVEEGRREMD